MENILACITEQHSGLSFLNRYSFAAGKDFLGPGGICAGEGMILAADCCNHRVLARCAGKESFEVFADSTDVTPNLCYPTDITIDRQGCVWVTDRWNHMVRRFDRSGKHLLDIGGCGEGVREFVEPWGIDCAGDEIFVADRGNHRFHILKLDGEESACFGSNGFSKEYYEGAGFKKGFVYELWTAQSSRLSTIETKLLQQGYKIGSLNYPEGLAVGGGGEIVVADKASDRVQVFSREGDVVGTIAGEFSERGFSHPRHISVGGNGELLIAFANDGRLLVVDDNSFNELSFSEHTRRVTASLVYENRLWIVNALDHEVLEFELNRF
jgi:NHL repeat